MSLGPVSQALEADLRAKIQQQALVIWLDADGTYNEFVDGLIAHPERVPYEVRAFRGSHLELMFELQGLADGVDRPAMVVHLPGFNTDSVLASPMLELYRAGACHQRRLDHAIIEAAAGRIPQDKLQSFVKDGTHTLAEADAWLTALLAGRNDGGLAEDVRNMSLTAIVDDLLAGGVLAGRIRNPSDRDIIWAQLKLQTGLPEAWRTQALPADPNPSPRDVAFCAAGWAMAVEYVHDLSRAPKAEDLQPAVTLPAPVAKACGELAAHLRNQHPNFYTETADQTEDGLKTETDAADAADLGRIDTFRFEEEEILKAALQALQDDDWAQAEAWAAPRIEGAAFWLKEQPLRRNAWELILDCARLGQAITTAGPKLAAEASLHLAVEAYVKRGAAVDEAHRRLEQRRTALIHLRLPESEVLRARLDKMRNVWRTWADEWARDFNRLCQMQGFLPPPSLQQRTLFDDVVRPLTKEAGTTAYFMVDAFRYEMAEEFKRDIEGKAATTVQLSARLAELPTVTEVGMNVLAPVVEQGRLQIEMANGKVRGFRSGEFRVSTKETRQRAMQARVGGPACPFLEVEDVVSRDVTSLKKAIARAKLIIVHSIEIDKAGENGAGTSVYASALQRLRAAWRLLRDAGVREFVFTADHGFLLLDQYTDALDAGPEQVVTHGKKTDPSRRHVFTQAAVDEAEKVRVPLSALDYDDAQGHLVVPAGTAVFDRGKNNKSFVHGGNSLQERVIPVLTVSHRAPAGAAALAYRTRGTAKPDQDGLHVLQGEILVDNAQGALDFGGPPEVELALRVLDEPAVRAEVCGTSGAARRVHGTIRARVGQPFRLLFHLHGPHEGRVRVLLDHPSAEITVVPEPIEGRFAVTAPVKKTDETTEQPPVSAPADHDYEGLPIAVRPLFEHIARHGVLTELEVMTMLGSARAGRRFANHFDEYKLHAPFDVTMRSVDGVKRYMKVGNQE